MADENVYKKMTRKADNALKGKVVAKHGKQTNQKLRPYVVLEYLMKYSDKNKKGFYVRQRKFEVADMMLLAECICSAKFIAEGQAKRIRHDTFLTDSVTDNRSTFTNRGNLSSVLQLF